MEHDYTILFSLCQIELKCLASQRATQRNAMCDSQDRKKQNPSTMQCIDDERWTDERTEQVLKTMFKKKKKDAINVGACELPIEKHPLSISHKNLLKTIFAHHHWPHRITGVYNV